MEYKVKSIYIKNKIKDCSFKNKTTREHIFDLIELEKLFANGCSNSGDAMLSQTLHERYPKEFNIIFEEVDKKGYQKYLDKQISKDKTLKATPRNWEREDDKNLWIKLGGIE